MVYSTLCDVSVCSGADYENAVVGGSAGLSGVSAD